MNIQQDCELRSSEARQAFVVKHFQRKHTDMEKNLVQRKNLMDLTNPYGRCFSVSDSGTMTITPNGTKIGDIIAFFPGIICPYVLRPTLKEDSSLYLFGEAYVDGYMK
jgi:hypothetical protein